MQECYTEALKILKFFPVSKVKKISPIGQWKLNKTFLIETPKGKFILQKLHPVFKKDLLKDIDKVTQRLYKNNYITPLLVKTKSNKLFYAFKNNIWRVFNYIPGETHDRNISDKKIISAALLIGNFHDVLKDLQYDFKFRIPNFHKTDKIMQKLEKTIKKYEGTKKHSQLNDIAKEIIGNYKPLKNKLKNLPRRVIHADLKIENVVFKNDKAVAIIDLDTFGRDKLAIELGDLLRSWCNLVPEWDIKNAKFDVRRFKTFINHYLKTARFITKREVVSIPNGVAVITLELSARFITDAYEEKYFRLNESKFKTLFEQNKVTGAAQLKLYKDFNSKIKEIEAFVKEKANSIY